MSLEITLVRQPNSLYISKLTPYLEKYLQYSHRSFKKVGFKTKNSFDKVMLHSLDGEGGAVTLQGFFHTVKELIDKNKDTYVVEDQRPIMPDVDWQAVKDLDLRDYHKPNIAKLLTCGESGVIHCSTGLGKTFIAMTICAAYPQLNTIVATPSKNVFNQTIKKFREQFPDKKIGCMGDGHRDIGDITITTYKSMKNCDLDRCQLLIMDEIQESTTPTAQECLVRMHPMRIYGLTATDEKLFSGADKVIKGVFGERIVDVPYTESVEIGAIVPCEVFMVRTGKSERWFGKEHRSRIIKGIKMYDKRNDLVASVCNVVPEGWQTIVFVETIKDHLKELYERMPKGTKFVHRNSDKKDINGLALSTKQQDEICAEFSRNEFQYLLATEALEAGTDFPNLRVVVIANGGSSYIGLTQKAGRGARILPESLRLELFVEPKTKFILIDFYDEHDEFLEAQSEKRLEIYKSHNWKINVVDTPEQIVWR